MRLYEVVRWGNASDDPLSGGPDGVDTCFLVRAGSVEAAAVLVDHVLAASHGETVASFAAAVYLLGDELSSDPEPRILRGPYLQHAYRHGWRHWYRDDPAERWVERIAT